MVLESLISPAKAEKSPWELFFIGVLYASIAIFLTLALFKDEGSWVMVFLTVLASTVLMYTTLRFEEEKDETATSEKTLLREHAKALTFFVFLFLGFTVAFTLWYAFLPHETSSSLFSSQINTIKAINGAVTSSGFFISIFTNNVRVLLFSVFFSFFYGLGAIFVLTWNASVIGAAAGNIVRSLLEKTLSETGSLTLTNYFAAISLGIGRYLIHGIPEIAAYFVGGLAGGLLSIAVMKRANFKRILLDVSWLTLIAIFILAVAAWMEVWITPIFF